MRRKYTFRAHGEQVVFVKKHNEREAHVIMKALLWALYLPDYPSIKVEVAIGDRYKPDLVQLDPWGDPVFWAEAGHVGMRKLASLIRRFPRTHFAMAKWDTGLSSFVALVQDAMQDAVRNAPFDAICFPDDSATRFFDADGHIRISPEDVPLMRVRR